jgi:regulator of protease activity HflC (stomatin/prohibitin superfamily)
VVRGPGIFCDSGAGVGAFFYMCTLVLNIPQQKVITRDNVAASRAITTNQDYRFAIAQYNQAAMRDVVGGLSLDELLSKRERIQEQIQAAVESQAHQWGISIESIQLQDIELAEREKRATITKADGDRLAAATMAANPIALELRTLQTIDSLGACPSNTVVLFPLELSQGLNALLRRTDEPPST